MSSFQILSLLAAATSVVALAGTPNVYAGSRRGSCYGEASADDTCCYLSPARLLQTQVWDTRPVSGPFDSWTIHGLWPIHNNGSIPTSCDTNRTYTNITQILHHAGAESTIDEMNKVWESADGDNEKFWQDQWVSHGTCFSSLNRECYGRHYEEAEEAVPYFQKAVSIFKRLPTYDWLRDAGIIPSYSMFYHLSDIQAALEQQHGSRVSLRCAGQRLHQIGYHFNVTGTLQDGYFTDSGAIGDWDDCPELVLYEPKGETKKAVFKFETFHPHTATDVEDL
ncbi:ribonuclease T2-like protein [Fusarium flagelliforme]|uniref:ribonuclease T2-like protein n=1 Tax=Fusarium flagelliforme TaxID=2675880 RepID=UPI001E8CF792|nr:ribonuclease T2-like protein [Fusarium flagelliforme]KAH7193323.1 ribonuclease T2-like protein [Fusarium flagelliforme]